MNLGAYIELAVVGTGVIGTLAILTVQAWKERKDPRPVYQDHADTLY